MTIEKIIEQVLTETIEKYLDNNLKFERSDTLLNKGQLAKKLGCDPGELERKYLSRPGFPRLDPHIAGIRVAYSDKAVDKWIAENLTSNY